MTLDWPVGFDRTPPSDRSPNNNYRTSLSRAFTDLEKELDRLDVDEFRYAFDARQRKTDQRPYSRANPDDPSFVLRWTMEGDQYAVACDRYSRLRDNVRTIGLYLKEKRKMEQRPVATGESEFANARLPPGDEDRRIVVGEVPAHEVLEIDRDADQAAILEAWRRRVAETHPDVGGDVDELNRVMKAKEEMLDAV